MELPRRQFANEDSKPETLGGDSMDSTRNPVKLVKGAKSVALGHNFRWCFDSVLKISSPSLSNTSSQLTQEGRGARDVLLLLITKIIIMAIFGGRLCVLHSLAQLSLTIAS